MIAVTGVWGLHRREQRIKNVYRFLERLQVPCLVVELTFDDEPWGLDRGGAFVSLRHELIHVRGTRAKHDLFQKEALMNLAIRALPTTSAVAWIDADVIFLNDDWPRRCEQELEHFDVVQPFGTTRYADQHWDLGKEVRSAGLRWSTRDQLFDDLTQTHPGLAWVARREWLERNPLYDRMPGGSNDTVMWKALTGGMARLAYQDKMSLAWRADMMQYVRSRAPTRVGYVEGCLVHMNHGDLRARDYSSRWDMPWFDPGRDLARDENGLPMWANEEARQNFERTQVLLEAS